MNARALTLRTLILTCLVWPICASAAQPLDAIREAARALVESHLGPLGNGTQLEVGRLDPRLRLDECPHPLTAWFPSGPPRQGSTTVGVRCEGARPWSLFVPVTVRSMGEVVVLARPVPAGAVLTAEDLRLEARDLGRIPGGYFSDPAQLIGQVLTRGGGAGAPVTRTSIKAAVLIKRGDAVTLSAARGGFAVRMAGVALSDAAPGERIRVRNTSSDRIVEGVVGPDRTVEIAM